MNTLPGIGAASGQKDKYKQRLTTLKEFDARVQSLIYQITTLSKLEAEKAEKKLLYDYLAAVMQELPEEPKAQAHMLDAMERTVKDLEQRKNGKPA